MCVQACVRQVCAVAYCMSDCTFCICLHGRVCVRAHGRLYDGEGEEEVEELGLKPTRSTSQRLGGPSPALMATHVNPTTPKNRSVEHNTRTDIYTQRERDARMHRYQLKESQSASRASCLVARLRPTFNTATHIFLRHRHVLWTGTTGLRTGQKGIATGPPFLCLPASHAPSHPCQKKTEKKLLLWSSGAAPVRRCPKRMVSTVRKHTVVNNQNL